MSHVYIEDSRRFCPPYNILRIVFICIENSIQKPGTEISLLLSKNIKQATRFTSPSKGRITMNGTYMPSYHRH